MLSIITVTKNDEAGLRNTLRSISHFSRNKDLKFEVIVIEGGDGFPEDLNKEYPSLARNLSLIRQKSSGIYPAMNEGLTYSKGDYVWFLNGGDEAATTFDNVYEEIQNSNAEVILWDYFYQARRKKYLRKSRSESYLWHALPTSHQAILYTRKGRFNQIFYPGEFSVCGDYAFTSLYKVYGAKFHFVPKPLSIFDGKGVSLTKGKEIAVEAWLVQKLILNYPIIVRILSSVRHFFSRIVRRFVENE